MKGKNYTLHNIVLFSQRVDIVASYHERRDCADQRISQFIQACGYLPVPIPNRIEVADQMVNCLNPVGIILTGGNSLSKCGGIAPERDETDTVLINLAINKHIPLYGFCRGMQSILDYFGCEIVNVANHVAVRHRIHGEENDAEVNSYHTQGCIEVVSKELEVVMRSEDGVIEKIKHKERMIMGTMWHPERENPFRKSDIYAIRELFGGETDESNYSCGRARNKAKKIYGESSQRDVVFYGKDYHREAD